MNDQEILLNIKNGKVEKGVKNLYTHFSTFKKWILKNGGDKEIAEDLFQECLVIFIKKIQDPQFQLDTKISTYLFAIGKNLWYKELRNRKPLEPLHTDEIAEAEGANDDKTYHYARQAFELLGEQCRELLTLFYYRKKSMEEIAQLFKFSTARVAITQKYRCIEKAKETYQQINKI